MSAGDAGSGSRLRTDAARARLARLSVGGDRFASLRVLLLLRPPREVRRSNAPVPEWLEALAAEMPSEAVDWFVVVGSLPSSLVPTPVTRRLSSAPDGKVVGPAIRGLFNGWLVQPVCTTRHSTLRVVCAVKRRLLPRVNIFRVFFSTLSCWYGSKVQNGCTGTDLA